MFMANPKWKPIPWVFFDLDDTLWNFTENSALALRKLYEISPILRKLFPVMEDYIDIYHKHNAQLWDMYARGEVTTAQLKLERWRRTLATRQFEVLTAVCEELERNYLDILAEEKSMIPGITDMLDWLTKRALVGVISNGFTKTQYKKLKFSGLDKYITRIIVSEEIGINKPNSRLFDYAVQETGATQPLLMVGDNFMADVLGAMKAGWNAIWFNPHNRPGRLSDKELAETGVDSKFLIGEVKDVTELQKVLDTFLNNPIKN